MHVEDVMQRNALAGLRKDPPSGGVPVGISAPIDKLCLGKHGPNLGFFFLPLLSCLSSQVMCDCCKHGNWGTQMTYAIFVEGALHIESKLGLAKALK
eukprot:846390-Pelagomonas_calceolata.AAC.1